MGWVNSKNPSNPSKKWIGLSDWVDMVLKNEKLIKNNEFWVKSDSDPTNPLTQ